MATVQNLLIDESGNRYTFQATVAQDGVQQKGGTLAVAKIGQLTTRTDNNTGELTMAGGHGITTGQRLDVYWTEGGVKGARRGMTVGTVATNAVPIDGGAGDNLPTNLTAVTAQVPTEEEFLMTGNNAQWIAAKASALKRALVTFADSSNVELAAIELEGDFSNNGYQWFTGSGVTNPLAGDAVAKVFLSNGASSGTNVVTVKVGAN